MINLATFKDETFTGVSNQIMHFINSNTLTLESCKIVIVPMTYQEWANVTKTKFLGALYYYKQ